MYTLYRKVHIPCSPHACSVGVKPSNHGCRYVLVTPRMTALHYVGDCQSRVTVPASSAETMKTCTPFH